jgi:hypothetical protein
MTAAQTRRPLPALIFVGALTILTLLVWYRVLNRSEGTPTTSPSTCASRSTPAPAPKVLPYPGRVSVQVLNAANRDGLAAKTQKALRQRGFTVTQIGNDGPAYGGRVLLRGVAQIRFGPQGRLGAELLHYYLPRASMRLTDASSATVTLSLGTRYGQLFAARTVTTRLRADGVQLSSRPRTPAPQPSPTC